MGLENVDATDGDLWWDSAEIPETAKRVARSMHEILNERDVDAVDEYHSDDLQYSRSSDERGGPEALKTDAQTFLDAFPDLEATILDVFADDEDDSVVVLHYEISGTHAGTFETIPPTDQRIEAGGIGIAELEEGEIVEFSLVFDNLGMLQDLGVIK